MTVSKGVLDIPPLDLPPFEPSPTGSTSIKFDPSDDLTYRLQYARPGCRVEIDLRRQVRADGEWKSLLVAEEHRPSLSNEARQEGDLAQPKDAKPMTQADLDRINEMLRSKPPRWGASTMNLGFPFDAAPASCMEVIGEYRITRNSFGLALFA